MIQWKGITAELDARPGGVYRVDMNGRDVILGEYVEIDRPHRVVVTFGWDAAETLIPAGSTRVEIDLISEADAYARSADPHGSARRSGRTARRLAGSTTCNASP